MELKLNSTAGLVIQAYEPGKLRINNVDYTHSLILTPTQVLPDWRPHNFTAIEANDFQSVLHLQPDVILLGVGVNLVFPTYAVLAEVYTARVGIEVMTTAAACRTYNLLVSDGRKVVAALLL